MHGAETRAQFAKLRAQGLSLARIAVELHVAKTTLVAWNRELQSELRSPRAVELRALQERLLPEEEVLRCTMFLRAVEQELASRPLRELSTGELQRFAALLRERLNELQAGQKRSSNGSATVKCD